MTLEDVTPDIQAEADKVDVESKSASKKLSTRRPNMNFIAMSIPIESTLHFTQSDATAQVISGRKVMFDGKESSLTAATRALLNKGTYDVAPAPYWTFNGKSLRDIYNEIYSEM